MKSTSDTPALKRAAHAVTVTAGQLSHAARMLPGFLICGAQRCGTTTMYRTLSQHPAVLKPVLHKGVHYFDTHYQHPLSWYQGHFPLRLHARRAGRAAGADALTFESSPYYLFHPLAAERIAADLPGVKLLVLVRDPVERAYSAHAHELARGYETEPFEQALALEESRLAGEAERIKADPAYYSLSYQHHAYRARGRYIEQLERLERLFGRDRIHLVDSMAFWSNPQPEFTTVEDFLHLPHATKIVFERHNARQRSPMSEEVRAELTAYFRPYDDQLAQWRGRKLSWQD